MEQQREDGQTDYWLVQYQRLLDRKPGTLIDKVGVTMVYESGRESEGVKEGWRKREKEGEVRKGERLCVA